MKCSKIAALLLLPVLLCTAGCSVKSGIRSGYEKVISACCADRRAHARQRRLHRRICRLL